MNNKKVACKYCRYYVPESQDLNYGKCHYKPPVVAREIGESQWPVIQEKQFCGQFEQKTEEPYPEPSPWKSEILPLGRGNNYGTPNPRYTPALQPD